MTASEWSKPGLALWSLATCHSIHAKIEMHFWNCTPKEGNFSYTLIDRTLRRTRIAFPHLVWLSWAFILLTPVEYSSSMLRCWQSIFLLYLPCPQPHLPPPLFWANGLWQHRCFLLITSWTKPCESLTHHHPYWLWDPAATCVKHGWGYWGQGGKQKQGTSSKGEKWPTIKAKSSLDEMCPFQQSVQLPWLGCPMSRQTPTQKNIEYVPPYFRLYSIDDKARCNPRHPINWPVPPLYLPNPKLDCKNSPIWLRWEPFSWPMAAPSEHNLGARVYIWAVGHLDAPIKCLLMFP